ncbi:HSF-type DNA-binding protein [Nitzschia inconspicua]|uniref:HSF-type DNA-binding protein n=1 Tax=Nitzschia inconspicua TaxID=303405 RepID=A0A9K3PEW4_9STRA|nr:HSF-type DNA-binding protein [Nitzschia inconspicua]
MDTSTRTAKTSTKRARKPIERSVTAQAKDGNDTKHNEIDEVDSSQIETADQQQDGQQLRRDIGSDRSQPNNSRLPFPMKLHRMLEEAEEKNLTHIVGWTHKGEGFKVHNKHAFEAKFIPRYFSTTTYRGYHRNLNLWGFKTVNRGGDRGTCWHPYFKKGRPELCQYMERMALKGNQAPAGQGEPGAARDPQDQYASLPAASASPGSGRTSLQASISLEGHKLNLSTENRGLENNNPPSMSTQYQEQGATVKLQNLNVLHPSHAVWKQNLNSLESLSQGASHIANQINFNHQIPQLPISLLQQLLPAPSSANFPLQEATTSSFLGNNATEESHLLQMLQNRTGQSRGSSSNPSDQMLQQLLLQLLQQNTPAPMSSAWTQNSLLNQNSVGSSLDLTNQIQLLLQTQQQQGQQDTIQQLIQTLQSQQQKPSHK